YHPARYYRPRHVHIQIRRRARIVAQRLLTDSAMVLRILAYAVIAILIAPMLIIIATSFSNVTYLGFPPTGLTLRWYYVALRKTEFLDSFYYSVQVALEAAAL